MLFEQTYTSERGPIATPFHEYAAGCQVAFDRLLRAAPLEAEVQRFLERNPCLVPGAWTPGSRSGHYPLHCSLIAQPRLPGLESRQPDFMWLATHSDSWFPTLIEIEAPTKRIYTASGTPRSEFTQARNQLAQWRTWFSTPANVQQFMEGYRVPDEWKHEKKMQLHMVLIYGRREEFEGNAQLSKLRSALLPGPDEELMSYDRLCPDEKLQEAISARIESSGRYRVVAIPPTFTLHPMMADRLLHLDGIEEAIDASAEIAVERKAFLKRRVEYWRTWAARSAKGVIGGSGTFYE